MRFKPFTQDYDFSKEALAEDYPAHIQPPIYSWLHTLVSKNELGYKATSFGTKIQSLKQSFVNDIGNHLKLSLPNDFDRFVTVIFSDSNLTSNFLALLLQNVCDASEAVKLEFILADGGSAYSVSRTDKNANEYARGVYDLTRRVPEIVQKQAAIALSQSELLEDAWNKCYSRNPDYEKVVTRCCDALEHLLRDKYEPGNTKPQLGKLLGNLEPAEKKLHFMGDTLLDSKFTLLKLISKATTVRGGHTAGTGRKPTPDEAVFVLHTSILIWNLHNQP